jgi:hypothetical protein
VGCFGVLIETKRVTENRHRIRVSSQLVFSYAHIDVPFGALRILADDNLELFAGGLKPSSPKEGDPLIQMSFRALRILNSVGRYAHKKSASQQTKH